MAYQLPELPKFMSTGCFNVLMCHLVVALCQSIYSPTNRNRAVAEAKRGRLSDSAEVDLDMMTEMTKTFLDERSQRNICSKIPYFLITSYFSIFTLKSLALFTCRFYSKNRYKSSRARNTSIYFYCILNLFYTGRHIWTVRAFPYYKFDMFCHPAWARGGYSSGPQT